MSWDTDWTERVIQDVMTVYRRFADMTGDSRIAAVLTMAWAQLVSRGEGWS